MKKPSVIFHLKKFKNRQQRKKVLRDGQCAKTDCNSGVIHCGRCDKWWMLSTRSRVANYESEAPRCIYCDHKPIIHDFYCRDHQNICHECEHDHAGFPCPRRRFRDGGLSRLAGGLRQKDIDGFMARVSKAKGKELAALCGLLPGFDPEWEILHAIGEAQTKNSEDSDSYLWSSDTRYAILQHKAKTKAGMARSKATG